MNEAGERRVREGSESRVAAVRVVARVLGAGATLESALLPERAPGAAALGTGQRAQAQALAYGAVRYAQRLGRVAAALLPRPWDEQTAELKALLLVGLYQLEYARTPPHAAVSTIVDAARGVGLGRVSGLVNAVLRRFQRERPALLARADATLAGRSSHPEWLVAALERDYGAAAEAVLLANNVPPPLVLRVNALRGTRAELAARLAAAGHASHTVPFAPQALVLDKPLDVRALPEFQAGLCSVQDAAAQLAVPLLAAEAGMRVLDACAAPGGKTCHVLEATPGLAALVALEIDAARAVRIEENLARLGLAVQLVVGDALAEDAGGGAPFERILLDAPCSGTGVIRRHPDIKLLRRPGDLPALIGRQRRLLAALWARLAPGGRLVYASCSILKAENSELIAAFLAQTPAAVDVTESASLAVRELPPAPVAAGPGLMLLPGAADTDGFYYACLEKRR